MIEARTRIFLPLLLALFSHHTLFSQEKESSAQPDTHKYAQADSDTNSGSTQPNSRAEKPYARQSTEKNTETEIDAPSDTGPDLSDQQTMHGQVDTQADTLEARIIKEIRIIGNKNTPTQAIEPYIPYKVGEVFNPSKTRLLISTLYFELKRFSNITVRVEPVGTSSLILEVIVAEKPTLKELIIQGNISITEKEIRTKINADGPTSIPAIEEAELKILGQKIKKLYLDKGFFEAAVEGQLTLDSDGRAIATLTITENKKSLVKRIQFVGNTHISSKILRGVIFTREDWLLSFLDKSGTFHPERLDADKHMIEQHYQNQGFLTAKVAEIERVLDPETKNMVLVFHIEEGAQYRISKVSAPGNDILSEEILLANIPLKEGAIYSRKAVSDSIKSLEFLWGNYGHIFAHIEPSIDTNDEEHTVAISLQSELGNKVTLNRINIRGNRKTRDKIIRRKLYLQEGGLLTNRLMELSKSSVEALGFFDPREGVNWKINRITEDVADLDLMLKETKTGNFNFQMGFGGSGIDIKSPASGFNVKMGLADRNLFGYGINTNFEGSWAKNEQTLLFHLGQPWLFDKPISGAFDIYLKRPTYDMLRNITPNAVSEKLAGGAIGAGVITMARNPLLNNTQIRANIGIDNINYEQRPQASLFEPTQRAQYQIILDKEFIPGKFFWFAQYLEQDTRNHPVHVSRGHRAMITSKIAAPTFGDRIGFYKLTMDASWYTPIINEYDLVFKFHVFLGWITRIGDNFIPFGEMFNIGGPSSVRGYLFGQIGPKFATDSIGAQKALFWNAELMFPITADMNIKGALFYDGGAGFDNPYVNNFNKIYIRDNNFDYRHAVGVGLRMLSPMPVKIDWGFKIDPRPGESAYEVHFGMTYDW